MFPRPTRLLGAFASGITLLITSTFVTHARAESPAVEKTLPANTHFLVPEPAQGSVQQVLDLLRQGQRQNALLIATMEATPQAVWLTSGTPSDVRAQVKQVLRLADAEQAVPVMVLYNIPGRDCGSYSAGGAQNTAAYEAWIDAIAQQIGNHKVVTLLEPDALANLPSDCGYPPSVDSAQLTSDRYTQINYAVNTLEANPRTLVYLDAGHSAWHAVGDMASRLVTGGVQQTQGFFSNVSNYQYTSHETKFDTWISECIAFASNPQDRGWRLGHYDYCASQYYPANPNDFSTWGLTDAWYAQNLGQAQPTTHFIIDTSRNGQGPLDASIYGAAPYNQPANVVTALNAGGWCNPPGRGLGTRSTADTGVALLDALFWVKTPGQSDGTCDAQGGARAWDYSLYTQPGWPTDAAAEALFDPLWGVVDPAAGAWFPQQALQLVQLANPPLHF